ncbi:hypothetical protein DICVIV_14036 [Dictyocaulus viviparus]|uniref:Uncharacterized protein n=1 Tax=Dictyocaulus viviparus TaxID=29172 RepID=A0A0D8X680_DICVI|nr:hypothetical protein DICVIV_14036 [Dictyocaulus viviparus]
MITYKSGIDNTEDYAYGCCRKGEKFHALKSGVKSQRIIMIARLNKKKIITRLKRAYKSFKTTPNTNNTEF